MRTFRKDFDRGDALARQQRQPLRQKVVAGAQNADTGSHILASAPDILAQPRTPRDDDAFAGTLALLLHR